MIKDCFIDFMSSYLDAKSLPPKGNSKIENDKLRIIVEKITSHLKTKGNQYTMDCSVGQSLWAEVPWIAVFDKDISTSATKGYDIVYLFRADMKGVYLSLNQGFTFYKNKYKPVRLAREKCSAVSKAWQQILGRYYDGYNTLSIDLHKRKEANTDLPDGYERGHICGKYYPIDQLPSDDELLKDLDGLLKVFQTLKCILGNHIKDTYSVVNKILYYHENGLMPNMIDDSDMSTIDDAMEAVKVTGTQTAPPNSLKQPSDTVGKPGKNDYEKKHKKQKILGDLGENYVLNHEKDKLVAQGLDDLAQRVKNVAKEVGDGIGYDILSFDPITRQEKHIEVKTTRGKAEEPFYVTRNELEVSKQEQDKYYLYRVYNLNEKDKTFDFYVLNGSLEEVLELKPTQYVAREVK